MEIMILDSQPTPTNIEVRLYNSRVANNCHTHKNYQKPSECIKSETSDDKKPKGKDDKPEGYLSRNTESHIHLFPPRKSTHPYSIPDRSSEKNKDKWVDKEAQYMYEECQSAYSSL